MALPQDKFQNAPNPQLSLPGVGPLILFFLVLSWLPIAPIVTGSLTILLPVTWSGTVNNLLTTGLLAGLLLMPTFAFVMLVYWQQWPGLPPLALALLVTAFYITIAALIRAVSEPGGQLETILRLTALTVAALIFGGIGLLRADVPGWMLSHAFGFDRPQLAGLLTALGLVAILILGWPITGALGDSWTSLWILLGAISISLPEEILFRGAILGMITFNFQHRKPLAALLAILIYALFMPTKFIPHNDWSALLLLFAAIPFALLLTELRALTGSIWAGILLASFYRAAPLLFTDPRVELPFITQPWQTLAYLWMIIGVAAMALLLWLGRTFLSPRWPLSRLLTTALVLLFTLIVGAVWSGFWFGVGQPGFYNDGFLIIMTEQANLSDVEAMTDPLARRQFVRDRLIKTAERTQAPVREALDAAGLSYRPFYIINMIRVEGHHRHKDDFADLRGVERVMLNPNVRPYPLTAPGIGYGDAPTSAGVAWNISQVHADEAWDLGIRGQGIVIAGQDTGYDWDHPALEDAYRGNKGETSVDHAYNWHDAWSDTPLPFDDDQHGTHTMGTMVGDDHNGNQIGMAPDAQWIGCRNMQRGLGNPASYTDCMEFFLAPYPTGGDSFIDGDVSKAPHVINNSWGCPDIEGCDDTVLEPAVDALRAAGIMMVVSAGNSGPGCQSVSEPPARYDSAFSVGATDDESQITSFSSRGPVPDSTLDKPDIAAPGSSVRSSIPGGGYGSADGTSMAGPHVAGLVALIWSANPDLIGQIDATEDIIRQSATPTEVNTTCSIEANTTAEPSLIEQVEAIQNSTSCACGDLTGTPNNVYGWGEINALEAVKLAQDWQP